MNKIKFHERKKNHAITHLLTAIKSIWNFKSLLFFLNCNLQEQCNHHVTKWYSKTEHGIKWNAVTKVENWKNACKRIVSCKKREYCKRRNLIIYVENCKRKNILAQWVAFQNVSVF